MTITLKQLRLEAQKQAEGLLSKKPNTDLLNERRFGSGFWKSAWNKLDVDKRTSSTATLFILMLSHPLTEKKAKNQWPWAQRTSVFTDSETKNWLNILLELDEVTPIYVDLLPDLGTWLCDVFNYIPRDVWSLSAQLIARLYQSSKSLYHSLYNDADVNGDDKAIARSEFFFARIEDTMNKIFDFHASIERLSKSKVTQDLTVRNVFCDTGASQNDKKTFNKKYGTHSHVHRHSLYLLFQLAMYDESWQSHIFDTEQTTLRDPLLRINDTSCLSVMHTAMFQIATFNGTHSALDWSEVESNGASLGSLASLPQSIEILRRTVFGEYCEGVIRSEVLINSAYDSNTNIQLVSRLDYELQRLTFADGQMSSFCSDVHQWTGADINGGEWDSFSYDYLVLWLNRFREVGVSSVLSQRLQALKNMNFVEQRQRFISCYGAFMDLHMYPLLSPLERKQAFFDLWYLSSEPNMFGEGFHSDLLDDSLYLVFESAEGLSQSIMTFVKSQFPKDNPVRGQAPHGVGEELYTKQLIILALLVHEQRYKCHRGELSQILRDGFLQDLFLLKVTETKMTKSIFKKSIKGGYTTSPIAVWLLSANEFNGYRTPILSQVTQNFLTKCTDESKKYNLFWRLSLYEPDSNIYKTFAKNLQFPFHLLGESPAEYTDVDWPSMCKKLSDHEANRKNLSGRKTGPLGFEEQLQSFAVIWSSFLQDNGTVFGLKQNPVWDDDKWSQMVSFWKEWMDPNTTPQTYLDLKGKKDEPEENRLESKLNLFFDNLEEFLSTILHDVPMETSDSTSNSVHDFREQFKDLMKKLESGLEAEFAKSLEDLLAHSPEAMKRQIPFELNMMYSDVVTKLQALLSKIVPREKKYLEWDKEIQSEHISLELMKSKFASDAGYWNHAQKAFEKNRVEQFVAQAWIDNFAEGSQLTQNSFEAALKQYDEVFETYPDGNLRPYQILSLKLAEQPGKLRRAYHPLLTYIDEKMQTLSNAPSKDDGQEVKWTVATGSMASKEATVASLDKELRKQGLHDLANSFSRGEVLSTGGSILRFAMNHGFTPFIAAVVSLTQLLDFGGSLLQIYKDFPLSANVISAVASLAFAFGYPFLARHREMGMRFIQSFGNVWPSFFMSFVMSVVLAGIWAEADGEADFGLATILLMLFFTTIVKAGIDGAFDTDKD